MTKVIKVGIAFEFYPDGEHAEMFEGMSEEEIVKYAQDLAYTDISQVVFDGRLGINLNTEITETKE